MVSNQQLNKQPEKFQKFKIIQAILKSNILSHIMIGIFQLSQKFQLSHKGAYINDVRFMRGGGSKMTQKNRIKEGKNRIREGGSNMTQKNRTSFMHDP